MQLIGYLEYISDLKYLNCAITWDVILFNYIKTMRITETIEPTYFIITAIGFIVLSFIQYKKYGKTLETKFLSGMAAFYVICFFVLNFYWFFKRDKTWVVSYLCNIRGIT